ncbi:MAG: response regulator, partial [Rickettsiales bacterium]|nr:response regulator [Rickettsiales bacterium]
MAPTVLSKYKILIADADKPLGKVLATMLEAMGFSDITVTRSGTEALELLKTRGFDFLITEWSLERMSGLELLQCIRRGEAVVDASFPVLMISGRCEREEVMSARDFGMNEYVLKPFTANTVYSRLQRLIEQPRNFIVSKNFVGPDRRFKGKPPEGVADRRSLPLTPQPRTQAVSTQLEGGLNARVWTADVTLKQKLGQQTSLSSLIT